MTQEEAANILSAAAHIRNKDKAEELLEPSERDRKLSFWPDEEHTSEDEENEKELLVYDEKVKTNRQAQSMYSIRTLSSDDGSDEEDDEEVDSEEEN